AQLDDAAYRQKRAGSFGGIHALLNHILLGDRRWLALFEHGDRVTPPLGQILYDEFAALRAARVEDDARLERFLASIDARSGRARSTTSIIRYARWSRRHTWHARTCSIIRRITADRCM